MNFANFSFNKEETFKLTNLFNSAVHDLQLELVKFLIYGGIDVNHKNIAKISFGNTTIDIMKEIIQANLNQSGLNDALFGAAGCKNLPLLKLLVESGANVEATFNNKNILYYTIIGPPGNYHPSICVDYLLSVGATIPSTIISICVNSCDTVLLNRFISDGYDIDTTDPNPLATAIASDEIKSFNILLENGANVSINNNEAIRTVIICNKNTSTYIKKLVSHGIDPDLVLEYAIKFRRSNIIDYCLKKIGTNPQAVVNKMKKKYFRSRLVMKLLKGYLDPQTYEILSGMRKKV